MRNISIHDICSTMYSAKSKALPAFHALTGSDSTSFFSGTANKSAYANWSTLPELTTTLCYLMDKPETPSSDVFGFLYSDGCQPSAPANIRSIFSHFRVSPLTKAEHVKRTTDQVGYVWGQSIISKQVLPSLSLWGWVKSETGWVPFWTALPRAVKAMNVLISCGCTTRCTGRCSCYNKGLMCTPRCSCSGAPILLLHRLQTNSIGVM